jgi:hypothetical protein
MKWESSLVQEFARIKANRALATRQAEIEKQDHNFVREMFGKCRPRLLATRRHICRIA